jgi:Tfp pilus assembly protein PilN
VNINEQRLDITLEQAETIKRGCGIPKKEELEEKVEPLTKSQVLTMLRPTLERLISEIARSLNYYRQNFKVPKVNRLLITGGSSRLKNITGFLSVNLGGIKVETVDPLTTISGWTDPLAAQQEFLEEVSPHLAVAFGLALGKRKGDVNLLPPEIVLQERLNLIKFGFKVALPLSLIAVISLGLLVSAHVLHYQRLLTRGRLTVESFAPTVKLIQEYDELKRAMDQRKDLLEAAMGRQPSWYGVIKELSNITPQEIVLSQLSLLEGSSPLKLVLVGSIFPSYTTIDMALSQYLLALDESPFFDEVELVSTTRDVTSPVPKAKFEIICRLVY